MIPKTFHLIWHSGPISYLRYLTFETLRKHHPDWTIKFHINRKYALNKSVNPWGYEQQDFQRHIGTDYTNKVKAIADEIIEHTDYTEFTPVVQSDFLRLDLLLREGGFYLDTDQIILKPFDDLTSYQYVYSYYVHNHKKHGPFPYAPNGVIGAEPGLKFLQMARDQVRSHFDQRVYNSTGPYLFKQLYDKLQKNKDPRFVRISKYNAKTLFYPVALSFDVEDIFSGKCHPGPEHYALHWFGGHPESQKFNNTYNEQVMKNGIDTISRIMRSP